MYLEIGKKYGDLICIKPLTEKNTAKSKFLMKCSVCGREKDMKGQVVTSEKGVTHRACGQFLKTKNKTFHKRWTTMRYRTTNDNYWSSHNYKDRGINSDEFELFIDFYDAMYESFVVHSLIYGEDNTSLERIDVNKPYTKSNCTWVTFAEQKGNMRKNRTFKAISPTGEEFISKNVSKFAKEHDLHQGSLSDVIHGRSSNHRGWKMEYID